MKIYKVKLGFIGSEEGWVCKLVQAENSIKALEEIEKELVKMPYAYVSDIEMLEDIM